MKRRTTLFVVTSVLTLGLMGSFTDAQSATVNEVLNWVKNKVLAWDRKINNANNRFKPTQFSGQVYRDNETKLVWEGTAANNASLTWEQAVIACLETAYGKRKGFRLPRADEFMTLIDPTNTVPALPVGHPFTVDPTGTYWTATDDPSDSTGLTALAVELLGGSIVSAGKASPSAAAWCVRGAGGAR